MTEAPDGGASKHDGWSSYLCGFASGNEEELLPAGGSPSSWPSPSLSSLGLIRGGVLQVSSYLDTVILHPPGIENTTSS